MINTTHLSRNRINTILQNLKSSDNTINQIKKYSTKEGFWTRTKAFFSNNLKNKLENKHDQISTTFEAIYCIGGKLENNEKIDTVAITNDIIETINYLNEKTIIKHSNLSIKLSNNNNSVMIQIVDNRNNTLMIKIN